MYRSARTRSEVEIDEAEPKNQHGNVVARDVSIMLETVGR